MNEKPLSDAERARLAQIRANRQIRAARAELKQDRAWLDWVMLPPGSYIVVTAVVGFVIWPWILYKQHHGVPDLVAAIIWDCALLAAAVAIAVKVIRTRKR